MTAEEASDVGLDSGEPGVAAANAERELRDILDIESDFQVEELTVNWTDCDEQVQEICYDLIDPS
jgi:hypothetical protein